MEFGKTKWSCQPKICWEVVGIEGSGVGVHELIGGSQLVGGSGTDFWILFELGVSRNRPEMLTGYKPGNFFDIEEDNGFRRLNVYFSH